ncbi:MAG: MBL fold metallo-hydrolase, partial [Actinomycetia bacterium]|nr:MBL fold metallo-hydrolase [Actinomycetes bacterium]
MAGPHVERVQGDIMPVNSYLIHGPSGLVIVDGQLTLSDADKVRRAIDAANVPVASMVLTHGHPDHYAGADRMLAGLDAPIIATAGADRVIRRDDDEKAAVVGPMMGDEWPARRRFPDEIVNDGDAVSRGGIELVVRNYGPAESADDTVWSLGDEAAFIGDLAYNQMHAYLADGHHAAWLSALSALEADLPGSATLYVGHGPPGGRELLARQREYVTTFVDEVARVAEVDAEERRRSMVERMQRVVPGEQLLFLME